jgi:redox-sensitive bicupin YhaK (pirin superfamily)
MKSILHKADTRGGAEHGWLSTKHSFSFADYYNPERMGFGALRVLNDDVIAGGTGFGMHPHNNMEIITIPIEGELEHKDSMGNIGVLKAGDVQVMSAGTGIVHSEYNKSKDKELKLFQIWITPDKTNHIPRYEDKSLDSRDFHNTLQNVVSPENGGGVLWIHQNAWLSLGKFDEGKTIEYKIKSKNNGLYIFVISGELKVGEHVLNARDGLGLMNFDSVKISFITDSYFFLIDLPVL